MLFTFFALVTTQFRQCDVHLLLGRETAQVSDYKKHSLSCKANSFTASQVRYRMLCNPRVRHRAHNSLQLLPNLSQMNPVHALRTDLRSTLISFPIQSRSFQWSCSCTVLLRNICNIWNICTVLLRNICNIWNICTVLLRNICNICTVLLRNIWLFLIPLVST